LHFLRGSWLLFRSNVSVLDWEPFGKLQSRFESGMLRFWTYFEPMVYGHTHVAWASNKLWLCNLLVSSSCLHARAEFRSLLLRSSFQCIANLVCLVDIP
jgi:hypothetical protein